MYHNDSEYRIFRQHRMGECPTEHITPSRGRIIHNTVYTLRKTLLIAQKKARKVSDANVNIIHKEVFRGDNSNSSPSC